MKNLTKKQIKEYLKNPEQCPHCGSDQIVRTDQMEAGFNQAWSNIACNSCGKEWTEIFTMTDVETIQH